MDWKHRLYHRSQQWYSKVLVSGGLLWFVFRKVELREVFESIRNVPATALGMYLLAMAVITVLAAWRWAWWLDYSQQRRIFPALVRATSIGYLYNLFMPSSVGGDALKWTSALHLGFSKRRLILSVVLDRVSGVLGVIVFGFVSALTMQTWGAVELQPTILWWFSMAFFGTVVLIGINATKWHLSSLPLLRRFHFLTTAEQYLKTVQPAVLVTVVISVIIHGISYYAMFILAEGLQLHINLWHFFTLGSITSLLLILPISFSGFGVTEVSYVYFFSQVGAPRDGVLALVALMNIFKFVLAFLGWLYDVGCQLIDRKRGVPRVPVWPTRS